MRLNCGKSPRYRPLAIVLIAIIVDPTAPVYSFQARRPPTRMQLALPLLQQLQCRASGFGSIARKSQFEGPGIRSFRIGLERRKKPETTTPSNFVDRPRVVCVKNLTDLMNAITHGAFSSILILPWESKAKFAELYDDLIDEWKPVGRTEQDAVLSIAKGIWRKRRMQAFLKNELEKHSCDPNHVAYNEVEMLRALYTQ